MSRDFVIVNERTPEGPPCGANNKNLVISPKLLARAQQ
jgi:hypothetical protein